MTKRIETAGDLVDVRRAAALVGRHPETVRRWVWSGRLTAQRRGRQIFVARSEVQALAGQISAVGSLGEWADRVRATHAVMPRGPSRRSAAELVIDDRLQRSGGARSRAGH